MTNPAVFGAAAYDDNVRAMHALVAESGDHVWRSIENMTLTMVLMSRARTPLEAFEIFEAYQRHAIEAQSEHVSHVTTMMTRAVESHVRSIKAVLPRV